MRRLGSRYHSILKAQFSGSRYFVPTTKDNFLLRASRHAHPKPPFARLANAAFAAASRQAHRDPTAVPRLPEPLSSGTRRIGTGTKDYLVLAKTHCAERSDPRARRRCSKSFLEKSLRRQASLSPPPASGKISWFHDSPD
jgi:hypothetical protein